MHNRKSTNSQVAFTLAELMITMSLMVIVSGICYGALRVAFSMQQNSNSRQQTLRQAQLALLRIVRDLRCAYIPRRFHHEGHSSDSVKDNRYFQGIADYSQGRSVDSVHFLVLGNYGPAERGYFLENSGATLRLVRRNNPVAYSDLRKREVGDAEVNIVMLENVHEFKIRYRDHQEHSYDSWRNQDETTKTSLPSIVEIELTVVPEIGDLIWLSQTVYIPLGGEDYTQEKTP